MLHRSRLLLPLPLLILSLALAPEAASDERSPIAQTDTASAPLVDSIEIDNRNIYDTSDPRYDNFLFRLANRLHWKTRRHVVARELLLKVGAPYSADLVAETARNLRERLAIYDAFIHIDSLPDGRLRVQVTTTDQWSLSGGANVRREANEFSYWVGVTERNFLGLNQLLSAAYYVEASEADHARLAFSDQRLFGKPIQFTAEYADDPRARHTRFTLSRPFYNLSQRLGLTAQYSDAGGRRDVYADDSVIARSYYDGDHATFGFTLRSGYHHKGMLSLHYRYLSEQTTERSYASADSVHADLADRSFPIDSLYHEVQISAGVAQVDFDTLHQVDGFGYTEDFTVGSAVSFSASRAVAPDSVVYDALGLSLAQSSHLGFGLVTLAGHGRIWFHRGDAVRRLLQLSAYYYNPASTWLTLAFRMDYQSDWRTAQTDDLILGGETGLRGYGKYFRTGDRRAVLNAEGRFFPQLELLSVFFGGAAFVDLGRSFRPGESLDWRGFYAGAGIGLRISFERTSRRSLFRCDLAYSEQYGWQLSLSTGQYFEVVSDVLALTSR